MCKYILNDRNKLKCIYIKVFYLPVMCLCLSLCCYDPNCAFLCKSALKIQSLQLGRDKALSLSGVNEI